MVNRLFTHYTSACMTFITILTFYDKCYIFFLWSLGCTRATFHSVYIMNGHPLGRFSAYFDTKPTDSLPFAELMTEVQQKQSQYRLVPLLCLIRIQSNEIQIFIFLWELYLNVYTVKLHTLSLPFLKQVCCIFQHLSDLFVQCSIWC